MTQPLVSIITTYYNSVSLGDFVTSSMDCLLKQTYKNIEFICVNDGSTDETLSQLQAYAEQDSRIKVYSKQNQKYAQYSKAYGQKMATGDYIFLFDHDDIIELEVIEKCLDVFRKDEDLDIVTPIIKTQTTDGVIKYISNLDQYIKSEEDFNFRKISGLEAINKTVGRYDIHIRGLYRTQSFTKHDYNYTEPLLNADEIVERLNFESAKFIASAKTTYTHYIHPSSSAKKPSLKKIDIVRTDVLLRQLFKEKDIYNNRSSIFEMTAYRNLINAVKTFHFFSHELSSKEKTFHLERIKESYRLLDKNILLKQYSLFTKIYHKILLSHFNIFFKYYQLK